MDISVDDSLNEWQTYMKNISSNLIELSEQIEFQLMTSKTKDLDNGYTGRTKAKADRCVETMAVLWRCNNLLTEVVEKAARLNSKRSLLYNPENEVRELLEVKPVVIETEHIAIGDRNLLGSENKEKKATPPELLKYMKSSFESLCRDVADISKAVEEVDNRLSGIKADISKLNSTAGGLGISKIPEIDTRKIRELERDPLMSVIELDKLVYDVEKYRAFIRSIEGEYENINKALERVREMLSELRELSRKSEIYLKETQKIFGTSAGGRPIIGDKIILSLEDWLKVLEERLSRGEAKAVSVGLTKLELECTYKLEIQRENFKDNYGKYTEWLDLKGQFKALLAKSAALQAKGLLREVSIGSLVEEVKNAVYAFPVNLENCRDRVGKFDLTLKEYQNRS
ncbi:MAG: hypothetical protein Q8930_10615 [Bacillota bacterium]|nr:hypothetical protein [Bacillota bacterium]